MSAWFWWLSTVSLVTFVTSLATLPWLVSKIPTDYFCHQRREPAPWKDAHPVLRLVMIALKNLLGVILLVGGIIMLLIPGQGILTIAMGLLLMDYPGKYRLERRIAAIPAVLRGLNWLRARRNVPPLVINQ